MYYGINPFHIIFYVYNSRCCKGLLSPNLAFIFNWERTPAAKQNPLTMRGCRGRDRMVIGIICQRNQCLSLLTSRVWIPLKPGLLDTTLCDKVCQWLANIRWSSPGTTVSFTNKTDSHDITEILLKVALNTITTTPSIAMTYISCFIHFG
jgi:hypothetical protein